MSPTTGEDAGGRVHEHEDETRRTEVIQIRVTHAEKAEIERRATAEHRPVSEYLRWRALTD